MLVVLAATGGYLPKAASGLAVGGALLAGLLATQRIGRTNVAPSVPSPSGPVGQNAPSPADLAA
jgi:hypothetical protein